MKHKFIFIHFNISRDQQ